MNNLYHIIQGYRNWQAYFHLSSFSSIFQNNGFSVQNFSDGTFKWQADLYFSFYYDGGTFKKKKTLERCKVHEGLSFTGILSEAQKGIDKVVELKIKQWQAYKDEIIASSEYLSVIKNQDDSIKRLIMEAEECMILDNPLRTSNFIVAFLEKYKPIKKD